MQITIKVLKGKDCTLEVGHFLIILCNCHLKYILIRLSGVTDVHYSGGERENRCSTPNTRHKSEAPFTWPTAK